MANPTASYTFTDTDGATRTLSAKQAADLLVKSGHSADADAAKAALTAGGSITVPAKGADKGGTLAPA